MSDLKVFLAMTKNTFLFALLSLCAPLCYAQTAVTDRDQIVQVLQYYVEGGTVGDSALTRKAFHTSARLQGARNGTYAELAINDYIARIAGSNPRKATYPYIDITGNAAIAKIEIVNMEGKPIFTDYMQLLKVDGRWVIVNKTYHRH